MALEAPKNYLRYTKILEKLEAHRRLILNDIRKYGEMLNRRAKLDKELSLINGKIERVKNYLNNVNFSQVRKVEESEIEPKEDSEYPYRPPGKTGFRPVDVDVFDRFEDDQRHSVDTRPRWKKLPNLSEYDGEERED